jgi:hypothetical protein
MARHSRKASPAHITAPRRADVAEVFDVQRDVVLLTTQLVSERGALETWQRRLQLREAWEKSHGGQSQLPALRQATAACHARVLDLERRLIDGRHLLRILRARQDAR